MKSERMVVVYEGAAVGADPEMAGKVIRAVVSEAARQAGRIHVVSVTLARRNIALRLESPEVITDVQCLEAKHIFGAVIRAALAGA